MKQNSPYKNSIIAYVGQNVSINCSVAGYPYDGLAGFITNSETPAVSLPSTEEYDGEVFTIKANVSTDGTYDCTIRWNFSPVVQKTTVVEFLPCKSS